MMTSLSLRVRLIAAFAVMLVALAGLGAWGAWRLWEMGAVSNRIIADNYESVVAAQQMKESLERQDSAALFLLLGERPRADAQLAEHRERFARALARASRNVTEAGEAEVIREIESMFADYTRTLDAWLAQAPAEGGARYFSEAEPRFNRLRAACDRLLTLNQEAMQRKAGEAASISRANVVSTLSLAAVLTFAGILLSALLAGSILRSIDQLTAATSAVAAGDLDVTVPVERGDEIGRLASAFNEMAGKLRQVRDSNLGELMRARQVLLENVSHLEAVDRMKSEFIARASHELRTPLMSFQMGIHLLLEDAANLTDRQQELLYLCRDESARLARLSTELLDLSKMEAGEARPRLVRVPAAALVRDAVEPLRLQVEATRRPSRTRPAAGPPGRDGGPRPDRARAGQPRHQRVEGDAGRRPRHGDRQAGRPGPRRHRRRHRVRHPGRAPPSHLRPLRPGPRHPRRRRRPRPLHLQADRRGAWRPDDRGVHRGRWGRRSRLRCPGLRG